MFPGATRTEQRRVAELRAAGRIRPVGPRLYVSVPAAEVRSTLRKSWTAIVANLFPGVLVSHRTALDYVPTPDGDVFLTGTSNRDVEFPGLRLRFTRGPAPLADDPPFVVTLRTSSLARAVLENLSTTRPSTRNRNLPIEQLEGRLEKILHVEGEAALNALRDRARAIAATLAWPKPFARLDALVEALLGTRTSRPNSAVGRARAAGEPFDAHCLGRLQLLLAQLMHPIAQRTDTFTGAGHARNKAFFEAYFSNYIEGTTFELEEAESIVFDHQPSPTRPEDAHDVVGTFEIVSDPAEMRRTPASFEELTTLLASRHARVMGGRPEIGPGAFKSRPNHAGNTTFVHPDYVVGTLRKGMELYASVPRGLPRAIYMMFLVSDVHPFADGNGRIGRIMMNAELASAGLATIIIPTVFRDDYVRALKAMTQRGRASVLVETLRRAHVFSALEFAPYLAIVAELRRRHWFRDPEDAKIDDGPA